MSNKGTQGLLKSDISLTREILKGNVSFSVSTSDIEGVKRLNVSPVAVLPPMVDIPYERSDILAERRGYMRQSIRYRTSVVANFVYMLIQVALSFVSAALVKVGLKAFYRAEALRRLKECDLVISCSDENFRESTSVLSLKPYWMVTWWSMLLSRLWEILISKFFGKPVVMFPNSVGPFQTWIGRFLSKLALNRCECILVREPISYCAVNSLKIRSPMISTSDTTLILKPSNNKNADEFSEPSIGVCPGFYSNSLTEEQISAYITVHAETLDKAIEKFGFTVVFLPHYIRGFRYDDLEVCELIARQMIHKGQTRIMRIVNVEEFKTVLDQMDMVISSKMHPAVLAASGYVPTVCIAYDQKQIGFYEQLDISDCVIPIRKLSYEELLQKIDYVWNRKDEMRSLLKARIPALQQNLHESVERTLVTGLGRKYADAAI
jgi:colanic acid/amylovoran biosynthesis protein